ncbi:MAG TPA: 2Fe-2S iron-sulfur cluster-binding protein, partial [Candidatus Limnocylindria bacterium]|nr:2Fe-2S iron-sulfur cluster-binding protein [Candidatus Limnocylindria bacterium]
MGNKITVRRGGSVWEAEFPGPVPVREALGRMGVHMDHPCGGRGTCGKCAAEMTGGVSAPSAAELRAGRRLTCQAVALGDCEVVLPPPA